MAHVFISYSHKDEEYVAKLAASIENHGISVWKDSEIEWGDKWPTVVEQHLDQSAAVVLVMSKKSKKSKWVSREVLRADRKGIPVFPLLLSGEAWLTVEDTQVPDVTDGQLPPKGFYQRLSQSTGKARKSTGEAKRASDPVARVKSESDLKADLVSRIGANVSNLDAPMGDRLAVVTQGPGGAGTTIRRGGPLRRYTATFFFGGKLQGRDRFSVELALRQGAWGHRFTISADTAEELVEAVAALHIEVLNDHPAAVQVATKATSGQTRFGRRPRL